MTPADHRVVLEALRATYAERKATYDAAFEARDWERATAIGHQLKGISDATDTVAAVFWPREENAA